MQRHRTPPSRPDGPPHRRTRRRLHTALLALTATSGLLLTACSASDTSSSGSSDHSDSHHSAGLPAPGPAGSAAAGENRRATGEPTRSPSTDYLSTFALDVDTASYGYARRVLDEGRLPDPSDVRPEEFINSFRQDYERPDGNGFTVTVDGARTDRPRWSLVRVGLATRAAESDDERPPAALTFVVDVSGSMQEIGRLDLAKRSLDTMTDKLRDDDSVALVTFSDEAKTVLPMTRLGDHRGRVHDAIDSLETEDSTNLGAGVETGYATATEGLRKGATNRVVLISDGLANTGDTDADSILERVAHERRDHGITLFGVGVGSDYGDALMERLADKGDGHTAYVGGDADARKVFVDQLPQNIDLAARDAKAQVAFDPETVAEFHLVGYEDRKVADDDFRDDNVDGGEVGPGHTVTALYAVRTRPGADGHLATASVRWLDPDTRSPHEESGQLETGALHGDLWEAPKSFQVTAVAAYFADSLRTGDDRSGELDTKTGSLPGNPGLDQLGERAHALADQTDDTDVQHLADAIDEASLMK
ncbi:von Willebrand factor type A domain-containing protein [Streptomyces sp. NPDC005648]|uniref:vWA domain-containing protein n=1 Tax=Streptomyces sp. NPDC005648 TaxID=3157044 RepID=UPI0033A7272F